MIFTVILLRIIDPLWNFILNFKDKLFTNKAIREIDIPQIFFIDGKVNM